MSALQENESNASARDKTIIEDGIASQLTNGNVILPEVAARVHSVCIGQTHKAPLGVLWTRKAVEHTPLADHISVVKEELYGSGKPTEHESERTWTYTPELGLSRLALEAQNGPFSARSRELVEMTSSVMGLLQEIIQQRAEPSALLDKDKDSRRARAQPVVVVENDAAGIILQKARAGANGGHSTKSKVAFCPSSAYAKVMEEFGLAGVAAYPVFFSSWWFALALHDFDDWRQDYLCILDYSFAFEYNVDQAAGGQSLSPLMKELAALWDMPNLPDELQTRRSHMLCSMTFFDLKRTHEAAVRNQKTDGLTVWVHTERDTWRDFKALDAAIFGHYLSLAPGVAGRDDLMLSGLVNDWVDLGPDLRYQECSQSVFALTRGSLAMTDLVRCYNRTVWMLNASFTSEERYVGFIIIAAACIWQLCNHRHDVWRYYSLGYDACSALQLLDLYKIASLADCYTPDLMPNTLPDAKVLSVPRQSYPYHVSINHTEYKGSVMLHTTLCEAVESGLLPATVVDYQIVFPLLLRNGEIDSANFLSHMDRHYCTHFADIMRSGHAHKFSRPYSRAIAALVMEEWWSGLYFAMGVGSLIEAQPDHIAHDRPH